MKIMMVMNKLKVQSDRGLLCAKQTGSILIS